MLCSVMMMMGMPEEKLSYFYHNISHPLSASYKYVFPRNFNNLVEEGENIIQSFHYYHHHDIFHSQ